MSSKMDISQLDETILIKKKQVQKELFRQSAIEYHFGLLETNNIYIKEKCFIQNIKCLFESDERCSELGFIFKSMEKYENKKLNLLEKIEWLESYNTMSVMELKKEMILLFKIRNELIKYCKYDANKAKIKNKNGDEYFDKICYEMKDIIDNYYDNINVNCNCRNAFCDRRMETLPTEFWIFHD